MLDENIPFPSGWCEGHLPSGAAMSRQLERVNSARNELSQNGTEPPDYALHFCALGVIDADLE